MKKYIKLIFALVITAGFIASCEEEDSFRDEIFNDNTNYPYVAIEDPNEVIEYSATGNNFWFLDRSLVAEDDGNQVRINYDSQDPNIIQHQVIIGLDGNNLPPQDGVVLATITQFPTQLIFTKDQVASALGMNVSDLEDDIIHFGGRSEDADGNVISSSENFEVFLADERHAYQYDWPFNQ